MLDFFFLQQRKTIQITLQKDVISTQKQPSCKKGCGPMQNVYYRKRCEIQVMAVMVGQ